MPSLYIQDDGLQLTRSWLKRHAPPDEELAAADAAAPSDCARFLRLRVQRVLNDAFLELLEWDDDQGCLRDSSTCYLRRRVDIKIHLRYLS